METVAELTVLAMAMFLAAFFCFRMILLPESTKNTINKIHEVEEIISKREINEMLQEFLKDIAEMEGGSCDAGSNNTK